MENEILEYLKLIISVATPVGAIVAFFIKRQDFKIDQLEKKTNQLEIMIAKIDVGLDYITRDLNEIKKSVTGLYDELCNCDDRRKK